MKRCALPLLCVLAFASGLSRLAIADPLSGLTLLPALALPASPSALVPRTSSPSATTHILWTNLDGRLSLWNYNEAGNFTQISYGPYAGWTAKAIADGPDDRQRVLWTHTNGTMSLWVLDNTTGQFTQHSFGPYAGWSASALSVSPGPGTDLTGAAGGDLTGLFPNPTIAPSAVDHTKLASDAASLAQVSGGNLSIDTGNVSMNDQSFIGPNTWDVFTYQRKTLGESSIGWFQDAAYTDGRAAWLSGYADIKLFTAKTARLTIDHNGYVGIGTETPQSALDVNGGLNVHDFAATGGATVAGVLHVGGDFVLNGRGGGAGNNGNAARALVDNGSSGLYLSNLQFFQEYASISQRIGCPQARSFCKNRQPI